MCNTVNYSVRNRSGIMAQHGVSNAKPSMVDLILRLPETKLSIKKHHRAKAKSKLNENLKVYLTIFACFISNLLFELK